MQLSSMWDDSKGIIPRHLTLWIEEGKLMYNAADRAFSEPALDFIIANEEFFIQFISEKTQKSIKVYPLAHNQKALWFLNQIDPQNISYNVSIAGKIKEPFRSEIFRKALLVLTERHIMLRSVFADIKGEKLTSCQIVMDQIIPFVEDIEVTQIAQKQLDELIYQKYKIPFDLRTGPLLKTYLFHTKGFTYFLFNIHHVICDAWSLKIFLKELFEIYDAILEERDPTPEPIIVDYGDYVFAAEDFLKEKEGIRQITFWNNLLKGKNFPLILPYDFDRPKIQSFNGATHHFAISEDLFQEFNKTADQLNVTPNVILFTLFEFLLSKLSSQKQFFIGIPVAARIKKEFLNVFGYMINMLAVDCFIDETKKASEYILENKSKIYSILENQEIPFSVVVESISPKRDPSRSPVFQVMYNFMNRRTLGYLLDLFNPSTDKFKKFGTLEISPYPINDQEGQFDLTLEILHTSDKFTCAFKYNTDLFKPESIKNFEIEYLELLNNFINNPHFSPSRVNLRDERSEIENIVIKATGTFSIEPVFPYLNFWMKELRMKADIDYSGYNQVFQQLLNPVSEFNTNFNGFNFAIIRLEDIVKPHIHDKDSIKISEKMKELSEALAIASEINPKGKYIVMFCPGSDYLHNLTDINSLINNWEEKILERFKNSLNIHVISSSETIEEYSVYDYYEPLGEEQGHIPYKDEFFISLATLMTRKIKSFYSLPVKAIAVDCDNTLWEGVVAEDGPMGVKIGLAERALQEFLIEQQNSGLLICLCSKNWEEDVFEVFEKNNQMILKREHIAFHRINWNPKSENLIQLAKEINIGLDSFVFFDDNPMECAEVRNNTPDVLTIQIPEEGFNIKQLRNSWIFDKLRITEEDRKRSEKYREEAVRSNFRSSVKSYKEFIKGLNLKIEIKPFQDENIPRISQLTYRTNQFNFTTLRKSESEIKNISTDKKFDCFQVSLSDRFGDYGLIGVVIVNKSSGYSVETFLLSCRVLGKGVEHFLISFLGERARLNNSGFLSITFTRTIKNIPSENFLVSNFGELVFINDEIQTFNIPVDRAAGFTFDPESNISTQETGAEEKIKVTPENKTNQDRNDFYYMILEKYLTLENIIAEVNKSSFMRPESGSGTIQKYKQTEKNIMSVWQQILKREDFSSTDNFFDIGGHSVLIPQIVIKLFRQFNIQINIVDIFQFPTVQELAAYIDGESKTVKPAPEIKQNSTGQKSSGKDIAIIGMAGRFPGAENIEDFWDIISSGKETITFYTKEELLKKGVDKTLLENENYVLANGNIVSADKFDSAFFGITPREADFMDPQHRVFLESCYEALESAGYTSEKYPGEIGVFAGCGMNNYLVKNLFQHPEPLRSLGEFQTIVNNNSDFLTTRVSYKLNLTGPSIDIQTACSTSLVAIHIACQNLLNHNCDIALAGGVFIQIPHAEGYMYEPGGIFSPDGHCKPFDSEANGILFGEGSGVVVLKRLEDAIRDCDTISGVIKGTAINNDGSNKVGYMAPSVNGQADVVRKAIAEANITPDSISYIETHGTGTKLGDPIEVNALTDVFKNASDRRDYCALGSIKGNIGHLDAAAGVAGVIKVVLMFNNRKLPPLVNFNRPNPELQLKDSPFFINKSLKEWPCNHGPRRAGISSFGIGGTNAHCILEEAPEAVKEASTRKYHFVPVTAKTSKALKNLNQSISHHVLNTGQDIADISYTLQQGRIHYKHRTLLICKKEPDKNIPLQMTDTDISGIQNLFNPRVVFMFTGQGSQYAGMTKDLYYEFLSFRNIVDKADLFLKENFNINILKYILQDPDDSLQNEINQTSVAQPLLFTVQYAIARLLEEFGLKPDALIGHSIGEYAAASVSGIFDFEDALKLVAWRGKLMQEQKPGAMLSVQLSYNEVLPFISDKVNLSLRNAPGLNVLSGEIRDIEEVYERVITAYPDIHVSRLKTSHAFHSYMMDPVLYPFNEILKSIKFGESKIPFISNLTGTWAGSRDLSNPEYWTDQIRSSVNFAGGVQELLKESNTYFIEVGPGNSLATLLSQYETDGNRIKISSTTRHPKKKLNDISVFLKSVGQAWVSGVNINWSDYYKNEKRYRVPLPTYPFERKRHWIDPKVPFNYFTEIQDNTAVSNSDSSEADFVGGEVNERLLSIHDRPVMDNEYIPPKSEIEKAIVKIWEDLLGIKGIGLEDDFFYMGGHSILASQVITRISERFHVRLPLESIFNYPTINGLISKIESETPVKPDNPDIISLDPDSRLPVSFDQSRLWIINQIDRNNPAYNILFTYRLKGNLNVDIFVKSLRILFERHAILRSSIRPIEGEPWCFIHNFEKIPITNLDFSSLLPEEVELQIQNFFTRESRNIFDIENGPLFRIYLVKIRDNEFIFHITVQHMVFDGWSWGIFVVELRQIYNDLLNNREISLRSLKYQYYDIANWQKKSITEDTFKDSIDYWKAQLKDHPSEINFPLDHARKKRNTGFGSREPLKLSADLSDKIRTLNQKENSTNFMTILAVFGLLLNKYSGDDDICIGAPTANRGNSKIEEIIGLFVNTIILRLRFDNSQTFEDLLHTTRQTTLEALAHQDLPFEKLVETLQPERKTNVNPIAQIIFAYQNTPRPPLDLEGIIPERVLIKDIVSPFDLTFYAWEDAGIIEGEIEFKTDFLEHDTIVRIKNNFIHLLNLVIENPEVRISNLSILSEEEAEKIKSFTGTRTDYPKDKTIVQLFEEQVRLYPDKTAVVFKGESYTYKQLNEKANQLARTLRKSGIRKNTPVGLLAEKSLLMIVSILGILKAGGGYVPVDPEYPEQRINFIMKDSGCKVLLSQDKYMKVAVEGVTKLNLNSPSSYHKDKSDVEKINSSSDLAYIMYTSGTTGIPKGSMILQHSVVRLVRNTNYIELAPEDRILLTGAIVFDATTFEIWGALLNGGSLYLVEKEAILNPRVLGEELLKNDITILWLTSPLFTQISEQRTDIFSKLKYLLVGGDVLSAPHINKVRKDNPKLKVINGYGPTENTTFSITYLIERDFEHNIPIGKPISNSTAYIFNKYMNYQPIGVIGELYVGGDGLSKGYLNREDLNRKSFIEHPYIPGERLYRTGDYARWLPDGNIEFHGRIDNQLKIRGFRVELEEIESVISEIEGIIETVIKPVKTDEGDIRLAAFLNVSDTFSTDTKELSRRIKEKLPPYMIPSAYRFMQGFPKTINGKTNKDALKLDIRDLVSSESHDLRTLSATEKIIYNIWSEALKIKDISVTDNFFEIGGNSLLAISVFSKIESVFNVELGLRIFFDSPRIKDLAETIDISINKSTKLKSVDKTTKTESKLVTGEI